MNEANQYELYVRSRLVSFFMGIGYGFLSLIISGVVITFYPSLSGEGLGFMVLCLMFVSFCAAQYSSRGKVRVTLLPDQIDFKWLKKTPFISEEDCICTPNDIALFEGNANYVDIGFIDSNGMTLCRRRFMFGFTQPMEQFRLQYLELYGAPVNKDSTPHSGTKQLAKVAISPTRVPLGEVVSHYSISFLVITTLGILFFGLISIGLVIAGIEERSIMMVLCSLITWIPSIYYVRAYYRCAPTVRV